MWVTSFSGAHDAWDYLFTAGYPGLGVPVSLFIDYLIYSNLILFKKQQHISYF